MAVSVAHVVRQYHPSIGGMEDVVQNIARQQLERYGQLPKVITLDRLFRNSTRHLPADEIVNGIPVVRLPYRGSSKYPLCPDVLRHVHDVDVIHVHGIDFFFDYLAMTRPLHRRPLVVSTHGGFFHTRFASAFKKIYFNTVTRMSSRAYARVIATSNNDGHIFNEIVPYPKLVVIENGVNVEKYSNQAAPTLNPTLLYFGRWSENKGILQAIEMFRQLVARQPGWKLIIAGREYDHSCETLTKLLHEFSLIGNVQLVPNPTDHELTNLMGESSYFICLSRHEGFGIAPIEAMSAGLTPLLSDIPPFRNLIEKSELGLLLTGNNTENIERLLALHSAGQSEYISRRIQMQNFVGRYNWCHIAEKYTDIYADLART